MRSPKRLSLFSRLKIEKLFEVMKLTITQLLSRETFSVSQEFEELGLRIPAECNPSVQFSSREIPLCFALLLANILKYV